MAKMRSIGVSVLVVSASVAFGACKKPASETHPDASYKVSAPRSTSTTTLERSSTVSIEDPTPSLAARVLEKQGKIGEALDSYMESREDPTNLANARLLTAILIRERNEAGYEYARTLIKEEIARKIASGDTDYLEKTQIGLNHVASAISLSQNFYAAESVKDKHLALLNRIGRIRKAIKKSPLKDEQAGFTLSEEIVDITTELFKIARSPEILLVSENVYIAIGKINVVKSLFGILRDPRYGTNEDARTQSLAAAQAAETAGDLETAAYKYYNAGKIFKAYTLLLAMGDTLKQKIDLDVFNETVTDPQRKPALIEQYAQKIVNGELDSALTLYGYRETGIVPVELSTFVAFLESVLPEAKKKLDAKVTEFVTASGLAPVKEATERSFATVGVVVDSLMHLQFDFRAACDYVKVANASEALDQDLSTLQSFDARYKKLNATADPLAHTVSQMATLLEKAKTTGECQGRRRASVDRSTLVAGRAPAMYSAIPQGAVRLDGATAVFDANRGAYHAQIVPLLQGRIETVIADYEGEINYRGGLEIEVIIDRVRSIEGNSPASSVIVSARSGDVSSGLQNAIKNAITGALYPTPEGTSAVVTIPVEPTGTPTFMQKLWYGIFG